MIAGQCQGYWAGQDVDSFQETSKRMTFLTCELMRKAESTKA